jgi:hypothetical protein
MAPTLLLPFGRIARAVAALALCVANVAVAEPPYGVDFRRPAADAGWEGPAEVVTDPHDAAAHGVRIRGQRTLAGPPIPVRPFRYYRLRFEAKTPQPTMVGVWFVTPDGRDIIADVYDRIVPAADWLEQTICFRAHADAAHARIRLHAGELPLLVRDLSVEEIPAPAAAAWADEVATRAPPVEFEPAADRWRHLPRTLARLREGGRLRIVMLGDSICNDTSNSLYETLLERAYPKCRIEVVTSVRGGTGCWYYKDEDRVQEHVLAYAPDLLMIAGISHRYDPAAIQDVIRQVRQKSECEILVMTGAVAPRRLLAAKHLVDRPPPKGLEDLELFTSRLRRVCREEAVEFLDVRSLWDEHLAREGIEYAAISRDAIHASREGKQILARFLWRYFLPQDE